MTPDDIHNRTPEDVANAEAKLLLKAELTLREITHQELADLLCAAGIDSSKASVDSKLSRGSFSAGFFLQCLKIIGCKELRIQSGRRGRPKSS